MRQPVKSPCRACGREESGKHAARCAPFRDWVRLIPEAAGAKAAQLRAAR